MSAPFRVAPPHRDNTCAVVVSYEPDPDLVRHLRAIIGVAQQVVVVDNASGADAQDTLDAAVAVPGVIALRNGQNVGLAGALNQGVRHARSLGCSWLVFFDQDSEPYPAFLSNVRTVFEKAQNRVPIGIIGVAYDDPHVPPNRRALAERDWCEATTVITSGSMIPVRVVDELGPYREDFFIDFVDIEYCLRARAAGFAVIQLTQPQMLHRCGNSTVHRLPWKRTGTSNHPAQRRYYAARNHMLVLRVYGRHEWTWAWKGIADRVKGTILLLLFESGRGTKLLWTVRGIWDGIRGRSGPLPRRSVLQ